MVTQRTLFNILLYQCSYSFFSDVLSCMLHSVSFNKFNQKNLSISGKEGVDVTNLSLLEPYFFNGTRTQFFNINQNLCILFVNVYQSFMVIHLHKCRNSHQKQKLKLNKRMQNLDTILLSSTFYVIKYCTFRNIYLFTQSLFNFMFQIFFLRKFR